MTKEEKQKNVLKKRIEMYKNDCSAWLKKEVESEYYGRANYVQGKLDAVESILALFDMTYNTCSEDDLDEWLEFDINN